MPRVCLTPRLILWFVDVSLVPQVRAKHGLHEADMPDADALRTNLQSFDFADFPTLTPAALRQLTDVVDVDIHKV